MAKNFFPGVGLLPIILMAQLGGNPLKAAEPNPPIRKPPTAAEIQKAFDNCLKKECEDFAEWSVEAYEACSEGGEHCCEMAREILASIHTSHKGEKVYDNYFPHSFPEDDLGNFPEDRWDITQGKRKDIR